MRKLLSIGFAACVALLTLGAATASAADTQNYTFANQTSGDSSTCGPDWANDTFTRVFKVYPERNVDGSYRMVENFTSGHFTTIQGKSPESCEAGNNSQISAGVHGSMHGSEVIKVTGARIRPPAPQRGTGPAVRPDLSPQRSEWAPPRT